MFSKVIIESAKSIRYSGAPETSKSFELINSLVIVWLSTGIPSLLSLCIAAKITRWFSFS